MDLLLSKLKALSDSTRLEIINLIMDNELCICQIQAMLNMSQPRISRHMRILREAGLIESRKDAQRTFYSIKANGNDNLLKAVNREMMNSKVKMKKRNMAKKMPLCKGVGNG